MISWDEEAADHTKSAEASMRGLPSWLENASRAAYRSSLSLSAKWESSHLLFRFACVFMITLQGPDCRTAKPSLWHKATGWEDNALSPCPQRIPWAYGIGYTQLPFATFLRWEQPREDSSAAHPRQWSRGGGHQGQGHSCVPARKILAVVSCASTLTGTGSTWEKLM